MTNSEYERLYKQAGKQWPVILSEKFREIKAAYLSAADKAAARVLAATEAGLSDLTSGAWQSIEDGLRAGAESISDAVEGAATSGITESYFLTQKRPGAGQIDVEYIMSAAPEGFLSRDRLAQLAVRTNDSLLASLFARTYQDGYTFSDRVWGGSGIGANYTDDIRNLIFSGVAQGRDVVDIAKDIELYVAKGREIVFTPGRYGELTPGTAEYAKRIRRMVDYRAFRLVRSELYASMQQAAVLQARINPACTGYVDWVLSAGHVEWGCVCSSYAEQGPYLIERVPSYPHPSCLCRIVPVLLPRAQFVDDLARFARGESVPYLSAWYNDVYLGKTSS